jgi:hypothetical protein
VGQLLCVAGKPERLRTTYSTANGTVGSIQTSQSVTAVGASTAWGNTAAGKTASGNMYAGHDGNVYNNTGNGWQKYDNGRWNSVDKPSSSRNWSGAENAQQRSGSGDANANRASQSGYDRGSQETSRSSGSGGYSWASQRDDLQREAQNRSRGGQESQRFQDFQRGGGDRWGGGGFSGGRFGGGGGFRGRR